MTGDEVMFLLLNLQKISLGMHFCFKPSSKAIIFCLQMWKGVADSKKAKRPSKEEIINY